MGCAGYAIKRNEPLADAVRRIVRGQIEQALAGLKDTKDAVEGIHSARKSLKRIRGLLRLIRPALPANVFRRHNRQFRDIGRMLSPARDVYVQQQTLEQLAVSDSTIALTYNAKLHDAEKAVVFNSDLRKKVSMKLSKARSDLEQWPLQKLTSACLADGLLQIYKKVRRIYQNVYADPSPENLHEWRKRTKDFWYALQLLEDFRSGCMDKQCRRTKKLSDCLGQDHDFYFIGENLRADPSARPRINLRRLERQLSKERCILQRKSFRLADKIFSDKPRSFRKRQIKKLPLGRGSFEVK